MTTETEARTKECRAPGVTTRKDEDGYIEWPYCSASGCMQWAWDIDTNQEIAAESGHDDVKFEGRCGLIK